MRATLAKRRGLRGCVDAVGAARRRRPIDTDTHRLPRRTWVLWVQAKVPWPDRAAVQA
jgi:hypothetical protein